MPPRRSTRITTQNSSASLATTTPAPVVDTNTNGVSQSSDSAPAATNGKAKATRAKTTKAPAAKAPKTSKAAGKKRAANDDNDEDEEKEDDAVKKPSRKRAKLDKTDVDGDAQADGNDAKDASKDDNKDADMDDKDDDDKNDKKDKKGKKVDKGEKIVEVLKRGAAPVDPMSGVVHSHQVYDSGTDIWDAMLNQTNIGNNNNKFYVIQILHPIGNTNSCSLLTRWGRVGERGQNKLTFMGSPAAAISEFKKTFKSKTAESWENRHNMKGKTGKYVWLERSFEEAKPVSKAADNEPIPDSKLEPDVQAFCNMVFSTDLMNAALSSMNYDARKLPLGNLSKNTILKGFAALKDLAEVLENPNGPRAKELGGLRNACDTLSAQYYTIIPHDFGRNRPEAIDSKPKLKRELELVDALGDMEIAQKMIDDGHTKDADGNPINPLDGHFQSLNLKSMDPIASATDEFTKLQEYVTTTHGHTHSSYRSHIKHAFRVERHEEEGRWSNAGHDNLKDGERLLLWHGSRSTNFAGILKQGLRIAPPEAPVTGYMFGKGVYFADAMSKSANYCHAYSSNNVGILLLCEVAAKPCYELVHSNYNAASECTAAGKLATLGLGKTQPAGWQDAGETLGHDGLKGCWMPKGGLTNNDATNYLQYNEYIVYDPAQIKLRYLLMVDMK